MIARALVLGSALTGGIAASQLPEFSLQYVQRLGGAVDALEKVVADFDASAAAAGLDRESALAQMQGTAFLDRRRADMTRTFARFDRLQEDLEAFKGQSAAARALNVPRRSDPQIVRATWAAYQPAVPVTPAGAGFGGAGLILGGAFAQSLRGLLARVMRRGRPA